MDPRLEARITREDNGNLLGAAVLCGVVCLLAWLAVGCGGSGLRTARSAVEYTATAADAADAVVSDGYTDAARDALDKSESLDEYRAIMRPWDAAVAAVTALRGALLAAEDALDAWGAGGQERWIGMAACIWAALTDVYDTMAALGLPLPESLTEAINYVSRFVAGICESAGGES